MSKHAIFAPTIRFLIASGKSCLEHDLIIAAKETRRTLTCDCAVKSITLDKHRFARTPSVSLEDVDRLHWILDIASQVDGFDGLHSIHGHGCKEVVIAEPLVSAQNTRDERMIRTFQ